MSDGSDGRMMPVTSRVARMVARIEWCQRKIAVLERELAEAQQAIELGLESVRALGVDSEPHESAGPRFGTLTLGGEWADGARPFYFRATGDEGPVEPAGQVQGAEAAAAIGEAFALFNARGVGETRPSVEDAMRGLDELSAKMDAMGIVPPCPGCVSEIGRVDPDCIHCHGTGRGVQETP